MNLYFLVEGRHTERKLYPHWLAHLMPHFVQVPHANDVSRNSYFLFSGQGQPHLLDRALPNAIKEINEIGRFDFLILCIDAEESTVDNLKNEVSARLEEQNEKLSTSTSFRLIVQNRCVETWLLGNRKMFPRNPSDNELRKYIDFYNVREKDPERLGVFSGFSTHASFHLAYLQAIFQERNEQYGKKNIGVAADKVFLEELIQRIKDFPDHLPTLQVFLGLIQKIAELTIPTSMDMPT